jgi:hypothetical protein
MNRYCQSEIIWLLIGFAWLPNTKAASNDELKLWYEKPAH